MSRNDLRFVALIDSLRFAAFRADTNALVAIDGDLDVVRGIARRTSARLDIEVHVYDRVTQKCDPIVWRPWEEDTSPAAA